MSGASHSVVGPDSFRVHGVEAAKYGLRTQEIVGADTPRATADIQSKSHVRSFSEGELRKILEAADLHESLPFSTLIWLLATTGTRIGEALGLIWKNVDLDRDRRDSLRSYGTPHAGGPTKTKRSREIGLPAHLANQLRRLRMKRGALTRADDFVFGTGLGTPMRQSNMMRRLWHPLLDTVTIDRAGFHRLRHTHASLLLAEGRPITRTSELPS